jgi:hypothetical protein
MKTTTALCCLLIAAAPLALAQDISGKRKKLESPYKSQADAKQHAADTRALSDCVQQTRTRRIDQRSPEWAKFVASCQQQQAQLQSQKQPPKR